MLASIHHPNIVRFYGMAVDDSHARGANYYLVTDLKDCDLRCACVVVCVCGGVRARVCVCVRVVVMIMLVLLV